MTGHLLQSYGYYNSNCDINNSNYGGRVVIEMYAIQCLANASLRGHILCSYRDYNKIVILITVIRREICK